MIWSWKHILLKTMLNDTIHFNRLATSRSLCLLDEFGKGTLTEGWSFQHHKFSMICHKFSTRRMYSHKTSPYCFRWHRFAWWNHKSLCLTWWTLKGLSLNYPHQGDRLLVWFRLLSREHQFIQFLFLYSTDIFFPSYRINWSSK